MSEKFETASNVHVIAEASKTRALTAILFPILAALMVLPAIITGEQLYGGIPVSRTAAAAGLLAIIAWWLTYSRFALAALKRVSYLAYTPSSLLLPSGEELPIASIARIAVRKTFWHKVLTVETSTGTRSFVVTFAKGRATDIQRSLQSSSLADRILIC